jgi:IS1 family transposase
MNNGGNNWQNSAADLDYDVISKRDRSNTGNNNWMRPKGIKVSRNSKQKSKSLKMKAAVESKTQKYTKI